MLALPVIDLTQIGHFHKTKMPCFPSIKSYAALRIEIVPGYEACKKGIGYDHLERSEVHENNMRFSMLCLLKRGRCNSDSVLWPDGKLQQVIHAIPKGHVCASSYHLFVSVH